MSSGNGPGRLPSLKNTGAAKPGLKFKPKVAARRSKEEREASAPKLESDETSKPNNDKKKPMNKRMTGPGNQNRRMARYLNNTHVVSTGPLAAGNFVGDKGGGPKRAFTKLEGGSGVSPLVLQGLKKMGGNEDDDDDEDDVDDNGEDDEDKKKSSAQNRFNMGKEYSIHDLNGSEDEGEETPDMDEETWRALKTEELFPIRPVRYRHQDLEVLQNANKEATSSDLTTREQTPAGLTVKQEPTDSANELQDTLKQRESELHKKLDDLSLAQKFQSLDQNESVAEVKSMNEDHERIWKKLNKINNKSNRFVLFQLPPKLPEFEHNVIKPEVGEAEQPAETKKDEDEKKSTKKKDAETAEPPPPLAGRIGSIRVHKSGRLTAKIGNVVMDISRGTETTFLQDAVTINQESDAPPFAELLGRVDGRVVITPRF
ncbi:hypothetical protein ZYGR_0AS04880 [Zygosaccharomyces rouxii]|uniref:DNA-directed RNA polymerase III subunit RPC4 n=1 Tax=Zygosaccharomyces rouxii TaxID=4956 RepID=A0A1Q3AHE3_ZYGRO|nr:hypothetical protein ZYGR_0AS04880 [Zygosaccharomyces rouxii]